VRVSVLQFGFLKRYFLWCGSEKENWNSPDTKEKSEAKTKVKKIINIFSIHATEKQE